MSGWYQKIAKDISAIPDAIKHYEDELQQARYEIKIKGNVEKASADMPGIVEQRFNQLQEIEAILQYMNIELRRLRSKHFKKYLENVTCMFAKCEITRQNKGGFLMTSKIRKNYLRWLYSSLLA